MREIIRFDGIRIHVVPKSRVNLSPIPRLSTPQNNKARSATLSVTRTHDVACRCMAAI
jgi:hypothetical protein